MDARDQTSKETAPSSAAALVDTYLAAGAAPQQAAALAEMRADRSPDDIEIDCNLLAAGLPADTLLAWAAADLPLNMIELAIANGLDIAQIADMPVDSLEHVARYLPLVGRLGVPVPELLALTTGVSAWTLAHFEFLAAGYPASDLLTLDGTGADIGDWALDHGQEDVPAPLDPALRQLALVLTGMLRLPHDVAVTMAELVPATARETAVRLLLDRTPVRDAIRGAIAIEGHDASQVRERQVTVVSPLARRDGGPSTPGQRA